MKICYFALGPETTASSRLRVYKIAAVLRSWGHTVETRVSYADVDDADVLVVQKVQTLYGEMQRWIDAGIPVLFDIDDPTDRLPPHSVMTVGSRELQNRHPKAVYIPDCLDVEDLDDYKRFQSLELTDVCWFGLSCNLYHTEIVAEACSELGLSFKVVTDLKNITLLKEVKGAEYCEWRLETIDRHIMLSDVVACPYLADRGRWGFGWVQAKGENRLLKAWGLATPVIGAPIPSYVEHGLKFCATTLKEWIKCFDKMKSVKVREVEAYAGRHIALGRTADVVAKEWLQLFEELRSARLSKSVDQ